MKKIITSILVIMSVIHGVKSQYLNTKSVKSPNVTSMERFNDIPINLFTGTPDISIPIQQIESGNIKIPIELRYHASSVKPNQPPSWVGLGWDLNCGGNISREVRGHYDEYVCPSSGSYACFTGYLAGGANILYNDPNWNNPNNIYYYNLGNIYSDQQADEFSFNFLGHSGKFYYAGSANGWVVISDEKIKVEVNGLFTPQECINNALYKYVTSANHTWMTDYYSSNQSVFFKEFTITTPDGSKYTFGGIDAVEFTTQYSGSGTCYNGIDLSSWLLKKIEDVNGKIINYNYVRNYPSLYLSHYCNTYSQSFTSNSCNPPEIVGSGVTGSQNGSFSTSQLMNSYRLAGRLVFPMYLKTIDTEIETVTFSSSPATTLFYTPTQLNSVDPPHQWDDANEQYGSSAPGAMSPYPIQPGWFPNLKTNKLTNIDIKSKATNTDVYKFTFEYFENSNQRFALSKFNMLGSDSSIQKKYEFKYDNIADLPLFGGNYIDHWGFYNNKNIGSALSGAFSNRETNPLYVTKGLLTEIKYPTGGTTSFIWEAHRHSRVLSDSKNQLNPYIGFAGGSRIKEIKSYTDVGILSSHKKYYYVTGYNSTLNPDTLSSSGVLNGIPKYEFSFNNIPSGNSNNSLFSFYLFSINSIANYNPTGNGSHIGYDEVVEVNLDNSYTKHFFTNYGTDINGISHFDEPPLGITGWVPGNQSIYMKYSSKESERGKTIGVFDFNKQDVLIKKRKITYRNDSNRFNDFLKQKIISSEFCPNGNSLLFAVAIKIFKYSYYPTSEEVTSYDLNGLNPITLTKNFSYNTNNQLAIEQITNSTQSNILQTKYFYPCDNTISTEPNFSILCQKNMINTPLKTENYYNSDLLSSQITKYGSFTSNILGQNMLLPQFIYAGKANVLEKKITYDFYDTSGNLTQYTPESGMPVTIIWGYNKTQPIAKFENATNAQVAAALGVANISSLTEANLPAIDALRNSSNTAIQKAMITTYTHKPLIGVSTITDPKGDVMRYNYDTFGRLQNVTDKNGNKLSENEYHYKP